VCVGIAGLVAATFGTPADVIKTRVMNQPTDPMSGRGLYYTGAVDCLKQTGVLHLLAEEHSARK
jgi:hypothetical protein